MTRIPRICLIPPLETYPGVVRFVQTAFGRLALLAGFGLFLFLLGFRDYLLLTLILSLFTFLPSQRRLLLLPATLTYWFLGYADFHWRLITDLMARAGLPREFFTAQNAALAILAVLLFCSFAIYLVGRSPLSRHIRHPVLTLLLFYSALVCIASYLPLPPLVEASLWVFLIILGRMLWYLCYSLKECRSGRGVHPIGEFGHYFPFWFPQNIPFAKGTAYLDRIEAKSAEDQARIQLKGLKLVAWAFLLHLFTVLFEVVFQGSSQTLGGTLRFQQYFGALQVYYQGVHCADLCRLPFNLSIPPLQQAIDLSVAGRPLPGPVNLAALVVNFFNDLLNFAVAGHIVIAIVRICGFNALRNTYSPLTSASIAEFWNRFFYYYKELLVEFFFYPFFFRFFKNRPRLRTYCATLAAAGFGNFLYHFYRDIEYIIEMGFFEALAAFHTFGFYAFVLGTTIFLSQWRHERLKRRQAHPFSRFTAPFFVIGFYCLASIFVDYRRHSITENFTFLLSLFNY